MRGKEASEREGGCTEQGVGVAREGVVSVGARGGVLGGRGVKGGG